MMIPTLQLAVVCSINSNTDENASSKVVSTNGSCSKLIDEIQTGRLEYSVLPSYIEALYLNFELFDSYQVLEINILLSFYTQNLHKLAILAPLEVTESTHACKCRFDSSLLHYLMQK